MLYPHIMRVLRFMRYQRFGLCFLVLVALSASTVTADVVSVQVFPQNPRPSSDVTILVTTDNICDQISGPTREGNHFRIDYSVIPILCGGGFPYTHGVNLGSLPVGEYTFEVDDEFGPPVASGAFVVIPAALPDTPTLSPAALAALCLILLGAGWVFIGRQA